MRHFEKKGAKPGALIFSYEKGVHRFLEIRGSSRNGRFVLSEPVLTSKMQRQSFFAQDCIEHFCKPISAALAREIAKHYGL